MIRYPFAILLIAGCGDRSAPAPDELAPLLRQDELTAPPALLAARDKATPQHEARARAFEVEGRAALTQARFGPAAKAFGTAALYAPTSLRLYAYAVASARVPRPRGTPAETSEAKRRDVITAEQTLQAAEALAGDTPSLAPLFAAERACLSRIERLEPTDPCYLPRLP
jgi:hypothetical protein